MGIPLYVEKNEGPAKGKISGSKWEGLSDKKKADMKWLERVITRPYLRNKYGHDIREATGDRKRDLEEYLETLERTWAAEDEEDG